MITHEQFTVQFDKLQAAFSTTKAPKVGDQWFEEFEDSEPHPFQQAMRRCQYGERFPTWDVFRTQYQNCLGVEEKLNYDGCGECHEGRVHYVDYVLAHKDFEHRVIVDVVANCICRKGKITRLINLDRRLLAMDAKGTYYTKRALDFLKGNQNDKQ